MVKKMTKKELRKLLKAFIKWAILNGHTEPLITLNEDEDYIIEGFLNDYKKKDKKN